MARKKANIHYLYKTTCLITGRYYIGMHSTYNLDDGYMGSGRRLRASLRKHGVDNHVKEIVEFFENRGLLIEAEKKVITEDMIKDTNCMNLMGGGTGGFVSLEACTKGGVNSIKILLNKLNTDEILKRKKSEKVSQANKRDFITRKNNGFGGDTFSDKKHSEVSKEKMSEKAKTRTGKLNSQFGTCWITKNDVNKKIKKDTLELYLDKGWVLGRK